MKKLICLLFICLFCQNVYASTKVDDLGDGLSYSDISSHLSFIEKQIKSQVPDIDLLINEVSYLNNISVQISSSRQKIVDEISLIEKRIEALGQTDENLPEAKVIAQKRNEFNQELSREKARISEADILLAKIDELNQRIFDLRNQMLWGNLLKNEGSFVNPKVFIKANGPDILPPARPCSSVPIMTIKPAFISDMKTAWRDPRIMK